MKIVLVIFLLSIQSSYIRNSESAAVAETADSVQFYSDSKGAWRIKTFATDQDVHPYSLGDAVPNLIALADANTEKHYGDVIATRYVIESTSGIEGLREQLRAKGLDDNLEISKAGFLFWAPKGTTYRTQSSPKK